MIRDLKINIDTFEKVNEFINITTSFDNEDVDLILYSDRYVVDARSILGVFSLNLTKDLTLRITGFKKGIEEEVAEKIQKFLVK